MSEMMAKESMFEIDASIMLVPPSAPCLPAVFVAMPLSMPMPMSEPCSPAVVFVAMPMPMPVSAPCLLARGGVCGHAYAGTILDSEVFVAMSMSMQG